MVFSSLPPFLQCSPTSFVSAQSNLVKTDQVANSICLSSCSKPISGEPARSRKKGNETFCQLISRLEESALGYSASEADFNLNASRQRIKCDLSSFQGGKIYDSSQESSEADDITCLKEVSGGYRVMWMVKRKIQVVLVQVVLSVD